MPLERKISNHTQNQKKKKGEEGVIRESSDVIGRPLF